MDWQNIIYLIKRKERSYKFKQRSMYWLYCSNPSILWRWKNLKQNQFREMNAETVNLISFPQGTILNEIDLESMCWKDDHRDRPAWFTYEMELGESRKSKVEIHYSLSVVTVQMMLEGEEKDHKHLTSKTVLFFFWRNIS